MASTSTLRWALIFLFILSVNCIKLPIDKSQDGIMAKTPARASIKQDDFYITSFLQDQLDTLSSDQQCWLQPGVTGLRILLQGNISQPPASIRNFALGIRNISTSGNAFSIDFAKDEFLVNDVSESTFIILGLIHLICMTLAFFLVYPIILLLASATVLCHLIGRPVNKKVVDRWQMILQLGVFAPLVAGGMVTGIFAKGTADHFSSEHGIVGLVTVSLTIVDVIIYFFLRRMSRGLSTFESIPRRVRYVHYADVALCQAILMISSFVLPDGIDDFAVMSLCDTAVLSDSWVFSLGMVLVFVWNGAMAAMTMQWFLVRRSRKVDAQETVPLCTVDSSRPISPIAETVTGLK
ncbi:Cytochrome b561 domain-containing protein [Trichoderma simmonsii]|uniref:Cytochrome b561 domain-containing protein n=1 Tax=Trichoderma simmonsii TaxID=1491479 RepID=A0A8G0LM57_9HYPO|nr:Cytochrome b561 domain-containing protein [Trichoderma simmonsii]